MVAIERTPLPGPPPQGGREEFAAPFSQDLKLHEPFGVYVHWPFCRAKCPYCDFNSHVRHGGIDEGRFLAAYLTELDHFAIARAGTDASPASSSAAARRR